MRLSKAKEIGVKAWRRVKSKNRHHGKWFSMKAGGYSQRPIMGVMFR